MIFKYWKDLKMCNNNNNNNNLYTFLHYGKTFLKGSVQSKRPCLTLELF